jgi:L-ascorbate metabolism protein UlaG (beta-lactamase superfamily)
MKPAFQKDDALLADIQQAKVAGRTRFWWLGQSGFLVVTPAGTVLFDPYLSDSLTRKYAATDKPHVRMTERVVSPDRLAGIDVITSSHIHTDHLDAETLRALLDVNPSARLVAPRANRAAVEERLGVLGDRLVELNDGESARLGELEFHGITAAHNRVERDANGNCHFMGFVLRAAGRTYYHSGDTLMHDGLAASLTPFQPDVAFVPINGNRPERRVAGNLNGSEAAALAREIGTGLAVPHHFDLFEFNTAPPDEFESACRRLGQSFRTLRNGEGFTLE